MGPRRIAPIWLRPWPTSLLLINRPTVYDPARQHGKPAPLLLAQACPQGFGGVSQASINRPPRDIGFTTTTQTLDEIGRRARLDLLLLDLHLNTRPVARGDLKCRPQLFLIRRQPKTRAKGSKTRIKEG